MRTLKEMQKEVEYILKRQIKNGELEKGKIGSVLELLVNLNIEDSHVFAENFEEGKPKKYFVKTLAHQIIVILQIASILKIDIQKAVTNRINEYNVTGQ